MYNRCICILYTYIPYYLYFTPYQLIYIGHNYDPYTLVNLV